MALRASSQTRSSRHQSDELSLRLITATPYIFVIFGVIA